MNRTRKTIIKAKMIPGILSPLLLCATLLNACNWTSARKETRTTTTARDENTPKLVKSVQLIAPARHDTCRFNQQINIAYANNKRYPVDSAILLYNNRPVATLDSATRQLTFKIPPGKCGENTIKIIAYHPGNRQGSATLPLIVKPDTPPRRLAFEIVNTYPHDPAASTQGLVYHDGHLYEGTGILGESTLRKIDLDNNKLLHMYSLASKYFGEGITIHGGKIYQITWTSREGFIYDPVTFRQEATFRYPTQGWGITTDGNRLIMSDGTHQLFILSPATFSRLATVEVYDHHGPVHSLNELEWIDGHVWANVWLTDKIVIIDPATGAVTAELYLPNILDPAQKIKLNMKEDVLNGIANLPHRGTILVTGKHWPTLFELKTK
ncbi:MAG: glutaminyl-peptide cyclotransferase [Odoribacteraceae bacterium]|jgi:glutamine cyclotransferase|nr:glutaminyl-peptide cyclotransferase [Odoribacteraceae bacterium]